MSEEARTQGGSPEPTEAIEHHERAWWRRAGRVALVLFAGLALLVGGIAVGVSLYLTDERLRDIVLGRLADAFHGSFELDRLSVSFSTMTVEAEGVRVFDPAGEIVLSAGRLDVRIEPRVLLRREVLLTAADALDLMVRLVPSEGAEEGAAFGLLDAFEPRAASSQDEGGAFAISVPNATVRGLSVLMVTDDGVELEVHGANVPSASFHFSDDRLRVGLSGAIEHFHLGMDDQEYDLYAVDIGELLLSMGPGAEGGVEVLELLASISPTDAPMPGDEDRLRAHGTVSGLGFEMDPSALGLSIEVSGLVDLASPALRSFMPEEAAGALGLGGEAELALELRGVTGAPRVLGRISTRDASALSERIVELSTDLSFEDDTLRLDDLSLILEDGRLDGSVSLDLSADPPAWSATARARSLPVHRLAVAWLSATSTDGAPLEAPPLPERLDGTVHVRGWGFEEPSGNVSLDVSVLGMARHFPPGVPDALSLAAQARFRPDAVRLERLWVEGGGAELSVTGRVPLGPRGTLDVVVEATHRDLGALLAAHDVPFTARGVSLEGSVKGSLTSPRIDGTLVVERASYSDMPELSLTAPFGFDGGVVTLQEARVGIADGVVSASGSLTLLDGELSLLDEPTVDVAVTASGLCLELITGGRVTGVASGEASARGALSSLSGRGAVGVEELVVEGVAFTRAIAKVEVDGDLLRLESLELVPSAGGVASASGTMSISDRGVAASIEAKEMPLALAAALLEDAPPVEGAIDFSAELRGSLEKPRLKARAEARGLRFDEVPVGSIEATLSGGMDDLGFDVALSTDAGALGAHGKLDVESGTIEATMRGERLRIEQMPFVVQSEVGLAGRVFVELSARGELGAPEVTGRLLARTLEIAGDRVGDGRVNVEITPAGGGAHEIVADVLGATRIEAELRLEPRLTFIANAGLEGLSLAWLVPALADHSVDAQLTGSLALRYLQTAPGGDGAAGDELTAAVNLRELLVTVGGERLVNTEPVRVHWDGATVRLDSLSLRGPRGTFDARGEVGESMSLSAKGSLEMELLGAFLAEVALASGTVDMDLTVEGPREAPEIVGVLGISRAVKLRPRRMIREVEISEGRVRFDPGRVSIERITGYVHGGMFSATGDVELDGLEPTNYRLSLQGQNLPLRTSELLVEANANVTVTGQGPRAKVAGRVDVVRGRYLERFELDRFVFRPARRTVAEPLAQRAPFLTEIDLDLRVTSLGAMEISADAGAFSLDMVLDADLDVSGTAAEPALAGRVEASRGGLEFPRARLDVARSIIEFVPAPGAGIRPRIDLRAEGEISPHTAGESAQTTYFVTLVLEGDLEEMVLDLTSDPALDRLEILSLLVTGRRPADALGAGEGRHAEAAMVFAGAQLAEPLTRFVTQQLESHLNVDLDLSAEVTTAGLTLIAGTEITRRLRFEWAFQRAFGEAAGSSAARARYLISDRVFLEGTTEASMNGAGGGSSDGARSHLELKLRFYGE